MHSSSVTVANRPISNDKKITNTLSDALHMISWRVSPAGASIGQQEKRYTKISFHREGQYKVLVTAKSRGGIPKTYEDEISVSVDVGSGIPH